MQATNSVSGSSKTGGLLLAAFRAGQTEAIKWVDLQIGDLIVTVAADAMKAAVGDRTGVRLPVSYAEAVTLCRELGCVSPTQWIADAMFAKANSQLTFVPLVRTAADSLKMTTVDFALRFNDGVEKQLAGKGPDDRDLIFGAWKLWIMHARLCERGAVNYGFWDKSRRPPSPIQTVGGQHDAAHYDYSQLFQPVKRMARKASTGEEVDLLDVIATKDKVPEKFITPYKESPAQQLIAPGPGPTSFTDGEETTINLVEILTAAGVDVAPVDGWQTRGRPGFAPEGIMIHHTAGPRKGDAPSLGLCVQGRIDKANPKNSLSGPLCHIVLARSGKANIVAANIANHAGQGAKQVLELVRKDEAVTGNAATNKYTDAIFGNTSFYGIEVENSGAADDTYPEEQINALANICAAICGAHGWTANRIVHHRQWTGRKVDMSFRGDLPGMVAQIMDAGSATFGISFMEDDEPLPEDAEQCLPWDEPAVVQQADGPTAFFEEEPMEEAEATTPEQSARPAKGKPNAKNKPRSVGAAAKKAGSGASKAARAAKPKKKAAAKPKAKAAAKPKKKAAAKPKAKAATKPKAKAAAKPKKKAAAKPKKKAAAKPKKKAAAKPKKKAAAKAKKRG